MRSTSTWIFSASLLLLAAGLAAQDGRITPEPGSGEYERLHGDTTGGFGGHASHSNNVGTSSEVGDDAPEQSANTQSDDALGELRAHDGEESSADYQSPGAPATADSGSADNDSAEES